MMSAEYTTTIHLRHPERTPDPYFVDGHYVWASALVFDLATEDVVGIYYDENGGTEFAHTPAIQHTRLRASQNQARWKPFSKLRYTTKRGEPRI